MAVLLRRRRPRIRQRSPARADDEPDRVPTLSSWLIGASIDLQPRFPSRSAAGLVINPSNRKTKQKQNKKSGRKT